MIQRPTRPKRKNTISPDTTLIRSRRDEDRPEFRSWAAQRSGRGRDRALVDHAEPRTQARRHRRRNRDRGATVGLAQARLSLRTGLPVFKGAVVRWFRAEIGRAHV